MNNRTVHKVRQYSTKKKCLKNIVRSGSAFMNYIHKCYRNKKLECFRRICFDFNFGTSFYVIFLNICHYYKT